MAKRTATFELTHDNWNDEAPPEDAGVFQMASNEEISQRTLKKAKRRLAEGSNTPSPFQGFGGFSSMSNSPNTPKLSFDFRKKAANQEVTPSSNGVLRSTAASTTPTAATTTTTTTLAFATATPSSTQNSKQIASTDIELSRSEYLKQLCCLNESLVAWISQHVKKNPYCLLTPVFSDYNKHMEELERKYKGVTLKSKPTTTPSNSEVDRLQLPPSAGRLSVGDGIVAAAATKTATPPTTTSGTTKVGFPNLQTGSTALTVSLFASNAKAAADAIQIKDGGALVKAGQLAAQQTNKRASDDDDDAHDSADSDNDNKTKEDKIQSVTEDDAFYSKRCKLFYKKDTSYVEKGVGTLYLKSIDDKTQLLIRAETKLGNILLNIRLTSNIPLQRLGKNNVSLVCIPNPPLDTKAPASEQQNVVTFLVRVKTTEDADDLFASLTKHKA